MDGSGPTDKSGLSSEAYAAYMREWRKTPAGQAALTTQRRRQRARQRAFARLASLHQHDFLTLFNDEMKKEES